MGCESGNCCGCEKKSSYLYACDCNFGCSKEKRAYFKTGVCACDYVCCEDPCKCAIAYWTPHGQIRSAY